MNSAIWVWRLAELRQSTMRQSNGATSGWKSRLDRDELGAPLAEHAQDGVVVQVRAEVSERACLGLAGLVAGELRGDGPGHDEDGAVRELLHPVGGGGEHALAADVFHQLGPEDGEPGEVVNLVESVAKPCLLSRP